MDSRDLHRHRSTGEILRKLTVISSLVSVTFNCTVLTISAATGRWVFGDVFCQVFAMVSQVLVTGSSWMIALCAIESCYLYILSNKHPTTFSEINIRVMVYGLYLLLLLLHTAPLYGWGEYSQYRGGLHMTMKMADVFGNSTNTIGHNRFIHSKDGNTSCNDKSDATTFNRQEFTPLAMYNVLRTFLHSEYQCDVRVMDGSEATAVLRFASIMSLDTFYSRFHDGDMVKKLYGALLEEFGVCRQPLTKLQLRVADGNDSYWQYRNVYLSFQELGICTLDVSNTDTIVCIWVSFLVLTSALLPYGTVFTCGCLLLKSPTIGSKRNSRQMIWSFVLCSIVGFLATVPYFYINIANPLWLHVTFAVNVTITALYYCNCLLYLLAAGGLARVCLLWPSRRDGPLHSMTYALTELRNAIL